MKALFISFIFSSLCLFQAKAGQTDNGTWHPNLQHQAEPVLFEQHIPAQNPRGRMVVRRLVRDGLRQQANHP